MANYNQISYGSSDSESVKKLQELLNNNGANLSVDGKFGPQTQDAVKKYQQENGLDVDGIVGENTWDALTNAGSTSGSSGTATAPKAPAAPEAPTFEYGAYEKSDVVKQAEALLQQQLSNKPGEYQSAWMTQLNDTLNKILNREKFSYDMNGDALYQQYKDQHTTQGKMAMMDTMGQAQAMTGGYGNSYAQSVGQQAYQGYLQQLNDKIPELYQLALDQYNREGDDLHTQASIMATMEDQDYGRYRDQVADYIAELGRLSEDARYQGEQDYGRYMDALNLAYGMHRDKIGDQQWQEQFDEAKRQFDLQYNKSKSTSSTPYTPGDDDDDDNDDDDTGSVSKAAIINMQKTLGVTADGIWGPESKDATEGLSAEEAYKLWNQGKLPGASPVSDANIKKFQSKLHPESQHDAVMRDMYGSYRQYVAQELKKIEHTLSDAEFAAIVNLYGLTAADGVPKR